MGKQRRNALGRFASGPVADVASAADRRAALAAVGTGSSSVSATPANPHGVECSGNDNGGDLMFCRECGPCRDSECPCHRDHDDTSSTQIEQGPPDVLGTAGSGRAPEFPSGTNGVRCSGNDNGGDLMQCRQCGPCRDSECPCCIEHR